MNIGILSDTHGRVAPARRALQVFDHHRVEHIIHCGDVGEVDVFELFVGRPFTFVWGNTDQPSHSLLAFLNTVGIHAPTKVPVRLTLDGKTFAVFHGHEPGFDAAERNLPVDYLLHGHSHVTRDERRGRTRIINPGALHRARPKTVAVLDTATDQLTFHEIAHG
jgi:putative phosphoesterase